MSKLPVPAKRSDTKDRRGRNLTPPSRKRPGDSLYVSDRELGLFPAHDPECRPRDDERTLGDYNDTNH